CVFGQIAGRNSPAARLVVSIGARGDPTWQLSGRMLLYIVLQRPSRCQSYDRRSSEWPEAGLGCTSALGSSSHLHTAHHYSTENTRQGESRRPSPPAGKCPATFQWCH